MSADTLISQLRLITVTTFVLGMITLLLVVVAFRRSRKESFWRMRRDAGRRGVRYFAVAVILLSVSAAFCLVTITVTYVEKRGEDQTADLPTATPAPYITPTNPIATQNTPLLSPTQTTQPTLETSSTTIPQETPSTIEAPETPASQEIAAVAPVATQPTTNAVITIQALDDVIGDDLKAIQPADSFNTTTQRLYVFFTYQNMTPGILWGQTLLKDGQVLQQYTQKWGITEKSGETFFFFGNDKGFEAGVYEIRLTVGEEGTLLAALTFTILPQG
jgi:hypothetical protein